MTQADPWLSVIIPTFNGEGTIGEALASVSAQNDPGVEVLVIDDGSTDSTLEIVSSYAPRLNLRILRREHTGNWVANTNRGIEESSGAYVSILHQDDRWERGRLATVRGALLENPDVRMCLHPSFFIGPDSAVLGLWRCPFARRGAVQIIPSHVFVERLLVQNFIAIPAPVFRRDSAVQVGLLDESLIYTADWDFWLKLVSLGASAFIPQPLTAFRVHAQSQTAVLAKDARYMEEQLLCVLQRHFDRCAAQGGKKRKLFQTALFSVKTNVAFMRFANGERSPWRLLLVDFVGLGPQGWGRFFRCSRIVERTVARLRARKHASPNHNLPAACRATGA